MDAVIIRQLEFIVALSGVVDFWIGARVMVIQLCLELVLAHVTRLRRDVFVFALCVARMGAVVVSIVSELELIMRIGREISLRHSRRSPVVFPFFYLAFA